ncbi:MAG: alpha/beta hydrolase-fold protein [Spirosomataceae bacterium]|jgi:enterochelin esterase-like enzyme
MTPKTSLQILKNNKINSVFLKRDVIYDLILPSKLVPNQKYPVLYMNDGQDFDQLGIADILNDFFNKTKKELIYVGIHTTELRLREYGTSYIPDYKGRGDLATNYMQFIISEMVPYILKRFPAYELPSQNTLCGFSLGGLSAMDICWENPHVFSKVGVFSGSFWWRDKSYEEGYSDDLDRIMHNKIKKSSHKNGLKFWFECGTNDEKADRNNNGIIDAIEDTLDLIKELKTKGYTENDIVYLEVDGGEHNFNTWKKVFPGFLAWSQSF